MADWLQQVKTWWQEGAGWQRMLVIGGILCVLLAVVGWQLFSGRHSAEMVPLFTDVGMEDSAAIKEYLDEHRIPHEIHKGGTVAVPADRVHTLRLQLASEGIPSGRTVGFEIMDDLSFGATDFERHVSYIRALQGELARTVEGFEEVKQARVHIVLPEESVFVSESAPASAAVFVELAPFAQMDPEAVGAVMNLVAAGVEGLDPEGVTVVDTNGRMLSAGVLQDPDEGSAADDNLQKQLIFEQNVSEELKATLEQVLGYGNVVVQVSADINFDTREIQQEIFEPVSGEEGLVTELHRVEEEFTGTSEEVEPPAGTDSNVPTYQYGYSGAGESSFERSEVTENVVVNRIVETRTVPPGEVQGLSVAVMVNSELTPEQEESLGNVVGAALGTDDVRDDQIAVLGVPFDSSLADEVREEMQREEVVDEPATGVIPGWAVPYLAVGGLLLVLIIGLLVGRQIFGSPTEDIPKDIPLAEEDLAGQLQMQKPEKRQQEIGQQREALLEAIGYADDGLESSAAEVAEENPARVADLLRTWLAEGNGSDMGPLPNDS